MTRFEITSGRLVESATNPQATMKARAAAGLKFEPEQDGQHDGGQEQKGCAVVGENRGDGGSEEDHQRGTAGGPRPPPQRAMCRAAQWKKPGFVEQQRDDDERHEGEGGVPDDVPDHRDVTGAG